MHCPFLGTLKLEDFKKLEKHDKLHHSLCKTEIPRSQVKNKCLLI